MQSSRTSRCVCYVLIMALVSTIAPLPLAKPASAQVLSQYGVGVVDFVNESGVQGDLLARLATDAVVVEMGKTNRYDVGITRSTMKAEMEKLDLRPPLSKLGVVRLGEALTADAMLEGSIKSVQLTGAGSNRRAAVTLVLQLIDVSSGEVINGAVQTGSSSARVGYSADDDELITEAVNNAAFLCVKTMVDYIIPEATVMMNIKESQIMLNKGARDGMKAGMRMIVLRKKEIIGYLEIQSVTAIDSVAKVTKSMRGMQPEDKARVIFDMPTVANPQKSEPLPSGAPKGAGAKSSAGSKISKFLVGLAIAAGIILIFKGGRGSEDSQNIGVDAATVITWNPTRYGHGQKVLEYQIIRDDFADGASPVMSIRDPSMIDRGRVDVRSLYGTTADTNVTYYRLDSNPATSYTESTYAVPMEPYGTTHTYSVRVLYRLTATSTDTTDDTGDTTTSKYYYTAPSNSVTATAIEQVKTADVISPAYDPNVGAPELLVSDLQEGSVNFEWQRKSGADVYYVKVEPVQPGQGPTWQSDVIYETGPTVSLPASARADLASVLSNSAYADKTMKWKVYCRHQADTSQVWLAGEEARFTIGGAPPTYP